MALLDAFNHNYDPKLDRPTDLMHVENYLLSYIQGPMILHEFGGLEDFSLKFQNSFIIKQRW